MKQGKYPLNFWISMELKERSDRVRRDKRLSHIKLYEDGVKKNEAEK